MSTGGNGGIERSPIDFYRVPEEVIKAWERGEYFTGNVPSLAYKYLGIALGLRGLYTYTGPSENDFKGVAKIDLKGQELIMTGVRFWDRKDQPDIKFWKTEFSHFLSDEKIIWTYRVFNFSSDADLFYPLATCKKLPSNINKVGAKGRFGFSETHWHELLQFLLSEDFTVTLENIENRGPESIETSGPKSTRVMLHFAEIKDDPKKSIRAEYRQLDQSGSDIVGESQFERISI
jgi:hypothetical protein